MMEQGAVTAIGGYAQDALRGPDRLAEVNGVTYATGKMYEVRPHEPQPDPLRVNTLSAIVDYLHANRDKIDRSRLVVHIVNPVQVTVVSELKGHNLSRHEYLRAVTNPPTFGFGTFYPREEFNIALQSLFGDTGDRSRVLALIKQISDESTATEKDDGVTQRVEVKKGLHLVEHAGVPNPVELAPYRTFAEVEQPSSPFVLRVRKAQGIEAALFEADGGAWRLEAIRRIAERLTSRIPGDVVVLS